MRTAIVASFVLVSTSVAASGLHAQDHDTVWVWNTRCHDPTIIAIRVRFDGMPVYLSSIPICSWERLFAKGHASFRFTPRRPLVWYGYRSDEGDSTPDVGDTTAANTPFEINFWQAGGETDAIELGLQAVASDGLHMNTIHLLWPTKPSATTMAPGLVLETWPEPQPGGSQMESTVAWIVAAYGAILATIVFGWNLYRDVSDRGRLRVQADLRDLIQPGVGVLQKDRIAYFITNTGRRPVWVNGLGGQFSGGGFVVGVTDNPLPHRLEPGQVMTELVPPGQFDPLRLRRIGAWDSLGREYWVPVRQQWALQKALLKLANRPERLGFRARLRPFLPRWTRL